MSFDLSIENTQKVCQVKAKRLKRSKILIPVNKKEEPDYAFMQSYIVQKEKEQIQHYQKYISNKIDKAKSNKRIEELELKNWEIFEIGKLFKLSQGKSKGLNHLTKIPTGINYLGATNLNNGVLCQVSNDENLIHKGNAIAFIRNGEGSMGYSIYKAENFIATSDISVGYNQNLNRYIGMFITTIADKARGKYNFGYKRSGKRLSKEKIMLPVNEKQEPDYEYMENYMKQLEYKKLNEYLIKKSS